MEGLGGNAGEGEIERVKRKETVRERGLKQVKKVENKWTTKDSVCV